jgi:F-type H+-transporting ATPase subunit b
MLTTHLFLAATSAAPHAPAPEGGLEKIVHEFGINTPDIIAQIISFCVVAFLLYKFFFKPTLATIDERQSKIEDGLRYTEEMKAKLAEAEKETAEVMKKASLEAQRIIVEARDSGKALLEKQTQEATAKAQDILAKTEQAIELERKKMLADVRDEISRLVVLTTSRVLSKDLPEDEKQKYAESAAKELSNV